jgi:23S rRNA pseudouridine2605 synthase
LGVARLQKLIASAGLASRRKAEEWIVAGRVSVDGEVVTDLGRQADPETQCIRVDGEPLPQPERVVLALHKPVGVVTSVSDPHAERVVVDLLGDDVDERVFPAGRLDRDSEGLVLMTNDGALMQAMTRPGGPVEKVYEVTVRGRPEAPMLDELRRGATLNGRELLPCEIEALTEGDSESRYRVVLHEGKKNQIRRMFGDRGHRVQRLVRTRIGPVALGSLDAGAYRRLSDEEVDALWACTGENAPA